MTISQDLRTRLVHKVAKGMSRRQAAAHFEVSPSSAIRFMHQYEMEGSVSPKVRGPYKRRLDPYGSDLLNWIEEAPDMTLQELSERLSSIHGIHAPKSTIDDWFRSRNISFKKKPRTPANRNALMCRRPGWFGANVRTGLASTPRRSAISYS